MAKYKYTIDVRPMTETQKLVQEFLKTNGPARPKDIGRAFNIPTLTASAWALGALKGLQKRSLAQKKDDGYWEAL